MRARESGVRPAWGAKAGCLCVFGFQKLFIQVFTSTRVSDTFHPRPRNVVHHPRKPVKKTKIRYVNFKTRVN